MLEWILSGVVTGWFVRNFTPPEPDELEIDYADDASVLHAATVFDQNGEWDQAIALYEFAASQWPDEHARYARNSIRSIEERRTCFGSDE